jgi:DNA polymerase-1
MSEPNLLAQPVRSELGKDIRRGFIPSKGRKLVVSDLSQIEMRTVAHLSNCLPMIDTFIRGGDIHVETAERMFSVPPDKQDRMLHRYPAKRVGFGVLMEITGFGLYVQMILAGVGDQWSEEKCDGLIVGWYDQYGEVLEWKHGIHAAVRRRMMAWDLWGRLRWIPEVKSVHKWVQNAGLRESVAHAISSTAQGIIKIHMAIIQERIEREFKDAVWPLLQIHDELLFEVEDGAVDDFKTYIQDVMDNSVVLNVPIRSSQASGDNWGDLEK